jgi:serine/threonine protein kinase
MDMNADSRDLPPPDPSEFWPETLRGASPKASADSSTACRRTDRPDHPQPGAANAGPPSPHSLGHKGSPACLLYPFLRTPVEPDEIGRLGNYRVLRLLGKGGMAFVFLAEDMALHRQVALKVLKPDLATEDAGERFLREARILASLKHQHLVTVYQVGQEGRVFYYAMELLQGETLESWMTRARRVELADILRLGEEIATGLVFLHSRNLVHRDVKPTNLWLEAPGQNIKILDLGLARLVNDDASFTYTGMLVGTPSFMSPEQARGERVDARSDLFSLGCVLYCLSTGRRPFDAPSTMAVLTALAVHAPDPPHELVPDLPVELSNLIMQLLEKDADDRPHSAAEVLAEIQRIAGSAGCPGPRSLSSSTTEVAPHSRPGKSRAVARRAASPRRRWAALAIVVLSGLVVCLGVALVLALKPPLSSKGSWAVDDPARAYLSNMQPTEITNWLKHPPHRGPRGELLGVEVEGKRSPHGLFMHPPPPDKGETTRLGFHLGKQYRTFHAQVSLNDGPPESETPLTFLVHGDGRLLWQSREVRSQAQTQTCSVSVQGVDVLTLEVVCPGDPRGGHAVWIEPYVLR